MYIFFNYKLNETVSKDMKLCYPTRFCTNPQNYNTETLQALYISSISYNHLIFHILGLCVALLTMQCFLCYETAGTVFWTMQLF